MPEVQTVNTYNQTVLPPWMQTAIQDILARGTGLANEPYQAYGGPRVAGFTPDQQSSFQAVRGNMTAPHMGWSGIGSAFAHESGMRDTSDNINTAAAGMPYFDNATGMFTTHGNRDTAGMATPYITEGSDYLRRAGEGSGLATANPYIASSVAPQGIAAANPYLGLAAGQIGMAGTSFPQMADAYMMPWMEGVNNRIAELGARNLSENLLPTLSDQFVRSGQFGSAQHRDIVGRSLRDTQDAILGQQAQALERGYGMAGQLYNQDASRYAGLAGTAGSLAGTAGGLGLSQQQQLLNAGTAVGGLTNADLARLQQSGLGIGQFGLERAGLAGADANRGIQAAQGIAGIGNSLIQASQFDAARNADARQADASRMLQAGSALGGLATGQNAMNLQNAGALGAVGDQQQQQVQTNLNTAYGDFQNQQQYPWQQLGGLSNIIHGLPMSTSSSGTQTSTSPSPSMVSQVGGLGLGAVGLANSGIFRAKGGAVRAPRKFSCGGKVSSGRGIGGYRMAA